MFYDKKYPRIAQEEISVVCGAYNYTKSFTVESIIKRQEPAPNANDYVIFQAWEARTHDIRSNQVVLRFSAQQYWYNKGDKDIY